MAKFLKYVSLVVLVVGLVGGAVVSAALLSNKNKAIEVKQSNSTAAFDSVEKTLPIALKHSKSYVPVRFVKEIVEESQKTKYKELLLAIITVESNFDFLARNSHGAVGCGGIKWKFWKDHLKEVGITSYRDMFDPRMCVVATDYVFTYYLTKAKFDVKRALRLYYCGENNPNCRRGEMYANKVLSVYAEYELTKRLTLQQSSEERR